IPTGAKVRRLPKILDSSEAIKLLEVSGFEVADEYISKQNPREQELYLVLERARNRLHDMQMNEVTEMAGSPERLAILQALQDQIKGPLENATRLASKPRRQPRPTTKRPTPARTRARSHA